MWLGISGVGCFVVVSSLALWLGLPHRLLTGLSSGAAIASTLFCYVLLSLPFDLFGGYILPRRFGRSSAAFSSFAGAWLTGILSQAILMGGSGLAILQAARWGVFAGVASVAFLMLALLHWQGFIARISGGLRKTQVDFNLLADALNQWGIPVPVLAVYESSDPGFVGGIVGLPGREQVIIPSAWLSKAQFPSQVAAVQVARRVGVLATGARTRGVCLAVIWNLAGFFIASQMPGSDLAGAPGLITVALWFTLWSFVGLLLLPSASRPGVFEADRFVLDRGVSRSSIEQTISVLDRMQDDEPERTRWIERIFHPVPSNSSRLEFLSRQRVSATGGGDPVTGAWQGARTALFLSWACLGFLGRAVHCNSGRSELWVLFPGD